MHCLPYLNACIAFLPLFASAIITGIAVPSTIARNSTIPVTIITADYIQSVEDVAIAFGLTAAGPNVLANESMGSTLLNSLYLGPTKSNILDNISTSVDIPEEVQSGQAVFNGVLYSLVGALYEPILKNFSVQVTVGSQTSQTLTASPS
ncbi:MAG: hypothetical protein Q9191_002668 [Dirinaria sp. TL-2023a]